MATTLQSLQNEVNTLRATIDNKTAPGLENKVTVLTNVVNGLITRLDTIENQQSVYITSSQLLSQIGEITDQIKDLSDAVSTVEDKLNKVSLPTETRYYLEESEISDFRNNFRQLRAFMVEVEDTRKAFIRLAARYNLTNSQL